MCKRVNPSVSSGGESSRRPTWVQRPFRQASREGALLLHPRSRSCEGIRERWDVLHRRPRR
eukprot:scaffold85_cov358-Pavlova_lutheri.AAC.28